jgi:ankyrin repeat protein
MAPLAETRNISSMAPLLKLPNELLLEVAVHLERFRDLNSLLRTSRFFHTTFHALLYRWVITADDTVRDDIVEWVLSESQVASLVHLLDNGLSANYKFECGRDLLRALCRLYGQERSVPLARLLIERGADIEARNANACTVLHEAIRKYNRGIAALLLAHGADANAVNKCGFTPLQDAVFYGTLGIATLLLAHGADVNANALDGYGYTPLHDAVADCNYGLVRLLLAHGADINALSTSGQTPLHMVSARRDHADPKLAKLLLEHDADVNAIDLHGRTLLHLISQDRGPRWDKDLSMAKFLVENGADVNAISKAGRSPLQEALSGDPHSKEYRDRLIGLLIAHGADVSELNSPDGE